MKKFFVVAALILGLFAAGCGSSKVSTVSSGQATAVAGISEPKILTGAAKCVETNR